MIEPIMYFGIGFLAAALLGLIIVPLVHARAVRLTVQRMEAATPLSLAEIQADKDQLRADFARSTRRLELDIERLTTRSASQLAELGTKTDALQRLKIDIGDKAATIFALETRDKTLRDQLRAAEDQLAAATTSLRDSQQALHDRQQELANLNTTLDQRSSLADAQRIELVAQSTQIDALKDRLAETDRQRQAAETRVEALQRELQSAAHDLASERNAAATLRSRIGELERNLATQVADADRLGGLIRDLETGSLALSRQLATAQAERSHLQSEIDAAHKTEIGLRSAVAEADGRVRSQTDILKSEKAQLQAQLERLTEERNRLRAEAADSAENAMLRERITDVAAQVASLTRALEGPNSPIDAILSSGAVRQNGVAHASAAADANAAPGPLAERIRALQIAAAKPRSASRGRRT
jgi:chromosome segregation ATPase